MSLKGTLRTIKQWFGGGEAHERVPEKHKAPEVPPLPLDGSNQQQVEDKQGQTPASRASRSPGEVTSSAAPREGRTQFNEHSARGPQQQIVIGLDFGTAFTKVVLGEFRVHYAVPFGPHSLDCNPCLLRSGISIDLENGQCRLGKPEDDGIWHADLKMPIIMGTVDLEAKIRATTFLALVFRHARDWFLETHEGTYRGRRIEWVVNLGVPTDTYDQPDLTTLYREMGEVGWAASVLPGPITLKRVRNLFEEAHAQPQDVPEGVRDRLLKPDRFFCFPEFAVQLTGYVRSPRRMDDLHALIDVGAGTVDVTVFNVWRNPDGDDLFPVFTQEVARLGTHFLIQRRLESASRTGDWKPSEFDNVPPDKEFLRHLGFDQAKLREIDREILNQVAQVIQSSLLYTHRNRYPTSPRWPTGVPTFLLGGGARVSAYRDRFARFEAEHPPFRIRPIPLDTPDDFDAPEACVRSFDRLSVAYGLSFSPDDIGEIRLKSETEDENAVAGAAPDLRDRFVGQELT